MDGYFFIFRHPQSIGIFMCITLLSACMADSGVSYAECKKSMGIRLKDLSKLGYRDNVARRLVVDIVSKHCKHDTKEQIEMTLSNILREPRIL